MPKLSLVTSDTKQVGTDLNRKLVSSKDWYFSELNFNLLRQYHDGSLPEEIEREY